MPLLDDLWWLIVRQSLVFRWEAEIVATQIQFAKSPCWSWRSQVQSCKSGVGNVVIPLLVRADRCDQVHLHLVGNIRAPYSKDDGVTFYFDLHVVLQQVVNVLRLHSFRIAHSDGALISALPPRDPRGYKLVEFEIFVCPPPVHFGCIIAAGIQDNVHAEGLFIRFAIKADSEPQHVLL